MAYSDLLARPYLAPSQYTTQMHMTPCSTSAILKRCSARVQMHRNSGILMILNVGFYLVSSQVMTHHQA